MFFLLLQIQLKCVRDNGAACLNAEELNTIYTNVIELELERAFNFTIDLGQDFIDSCPALSQNEAAVVRRATDSDRCGYLTYKASQRDYDACLAGAFDRINPEIKLWNSLNDPTSTQKYTDAIGVVRFFSDIFSLAQG